MKGIVTINTDAGWFRHQKVGSFAYWIKGDGIHLHGSGMLKGKIMSSTEAETKAIANALYILKESGVTGIKRIIINRDNIRAVNKKRGREEQKLVYQLLRHFWDKTNHETEFTKFYTFRHVKAHSNGTLARDWVNNWCDARCKERLKEWLKQNPY